MPAIVCSYINPDLDGIACSIALEFLGRPQWSARLLGAIDAETSVVLQDLGFTPPPAVDTWGDIDEIWLVDTHHPFQLPPDLPESRVTRITDHHPGGDPRRYPNADIQNESVGAAATLVSERFEDMKAAIPPNLAMLLQAAIISNTLNFLAPATCHRDRNVYERLQSIKHVPDNLFDRMQQARTAVLRGETRSILRTDTKIFETECGPVIVSQLEAPGALELLARSDLTDSLEEMAASAKCSSAVVNLVDTVLGKSAVVATDSRITLRIAAGIQQSPGGDGVIRIDRLLQRKTDIIPYIVTARS
jgi:manganese-dependent inorganic pyrophosphatase